MAALATFDSFSPSRFLENAEALVNEGMQSGLQIGLTAATQAGTSLVAGFAMETWGDKAHVAGLPMDALAGLVIFGAGLGKVGGEEAAPYLQAAGLGALSCAAARAGRRLAEVRREKAAEAELMERKQRVIQAAATQHAAQQK